MIPEDKETLQEREIWSFKNWSQYKQVSVRCLSQSDDLFYVIQTYM